MKNTAVRFFFCTLVGLAMDGPNIAEAARLFGDTFETGTVGAAIGAPWGANIGTANSALYNNAANPFPTTGSIYADLIDDSTTNQIRLLSNASNNNDLSPNINGQVTTYSFDFEDVGGNPAVVGTGLIFGYYRQQANVDMNGTGRSYSGFLHNGNVNTAGTVLGGAAGTYTSGTVNTVFLVANDTASTVTNYAGSGHDLAPTSADVWLAVASGTPTYVYSVAKQNAATGTAVSGVGFRSFTGDEEHFNVDNVLLQSGATFDRTAVVAFPTFVVNRDTGDISVSNTSSVGFNLRGYTLSSAAGALKPGSWNSIADTGDSDSGGSFDPSGVWSKTSTLATQLAESSASGSGGLLAGSGSRSLGISWTRSPYQDLVATYVASDGSVGAALVSYTGAADSRSDLNGDGVVNAADWSLLLAGSGASFTGQTKIQAHQQGDVDGDLDNDFADFRLFKADYDTANGQGAFNALLQGVPEPSTAALVALGIAGVIFTRRHPKATLIIMTAICTGASFGHAAMAATPVTYKASGDPGLFPDSNGQVDDAWFTSIPAA
ncbi:MAG TPA: PEP-CTERM sorting domain-containing protein, partial [Lacipirellulaceae bacterium]|nr:PEP-CTERM sorting domain-containing protein [Lacipirellulaceae bacterium]